MNNHIESLLAILLDKLAREDERHDAALYLFENDDPRVLNAFLKIGQDKAELHVLLEAAGEGIGEFWSRNNIFDLVNLKTLTDISRDVAVAIMKRKNPELLKFR